MWMHLGERDESDRLLEVAANDAQRVYWFYDCQVMQRQVMQCLLDGKWDEATRMAEEVGSIGGHDPNLALGSQCQIGLGETREG